MATLAIGASAQAPTVKIGWFGPATGDSALWGQAELNTVKLMAEQYNAKGGITVGGKKYLVEIVGYDDKGDSVEAVNVAKRLISQDKVVAIVGAQGSGEAIPVATIVNGAKVPLVASTATNPKVTVQDSGAVNQFMFRACFTDPYQGKTAAYYAFQKLGKRKAGIVMTIDDPYSTGLSDFFKQNFEKAGGKVVVEVSYTSGEKDFRAPLTKLKAANPDLVFIPAYYNDVALIAKQARELGIKQILLGGDGWPSENLISLAGKSLEGCMFINHLDMDGAQSKPIRDAYKAKYNKNAELNSYMVHDALWMVVDAMQRAKSIDPIAIQKALTTCDIQGVTGHIKIGPQHDPVGKDAWIIQIVGPKMKFKEKFAAKD
ncbi:MAG TPA: ABC transporter substrate-binding protein [Holophaga sp.]|nr:ABC transporter substrate-binding protein [Holophaga sp.]HPS66985.1 ABC transporter substrate-binding protein [Holophaga sp.]